MEQINHVHGIMFAIKDSVLLVDSVCASWMCWLTISIWADIYPNLTFSLRRPLILTMSCIGEAILLIHLVSREAWRICWRCHLYQGDLCLLLGIPSRYLRCNLGVHQDKIINTLLEPRIHTCADVTTKDMITLDETITQPSAAACRPRRPWELLDKWLIWNVSNNYLALKLLRDLLKKVSIESMMQVEPHSCS